VPLLVAADNGHKSMVELLLARGADVSGGGLNPLYEAVKYGYQGVAEVLLANKADVNLRSGTDTSGMRPVHIAARDGRAELLQLLIQHGADVNVSAKEMGYTPLQLAARTDETNTAKLLLDSKADIEARDNNGGTALLLAAEKGSTAMVSLLLNSGADVNATNYFNGTPLLYAVYNGRVDAARVLLQHKADLNRFGRVTNPYRSPDMTQPVYTAVLNKNDEMLKLVLDAGADPEGNGTWTNAPYTSPLFAAINQNSVTAVQLLLDHGANPNRLDKDGNPELSEVLRQGRDKRMVPLLLAKGADANARNQYGAPPLFAAQDAEVARWLIEHKADVNARLSRGQTPLINDAYNSNVVAVLIDSGAKIDLQETNGNTALHLAVYYSSPGSVAMLLAHKANPNIQNDLGYTPRDMAEAGKQGQSLAQMLQSGQGSQPPPKEAQEQIADMLSNAGGLVNLPKRNRIEVRRGQNAVTGLNKGSHDWNRSSVLEVIARSYGLLTRSTAGDWGKSTHIWENLFNSQLRFPDFKNVVIYRRTDASAKQKEINVNVEEMLKTGDCSRDVWL
jgi:ankyrin repeat protein